MTRLRLSLLALFGALAAPAVCHAQAEEPQDWTLTRVDDRQATVATIDFTTGLGLVARCMDGVYDLIILGLPDASRSATTRELGLSVGEDSDLRTTVWTVGDKRSTAFSRVPAMVARQLAEGGKLQLVVPGAEGQPRTRYVMDLDPSSTALEQTLTDCGRPLVDPRDRDIEGNGQDGLPGGVNWAQAPRPRFPFPVGGRSPTLGYVVMSCGVQATGQLTACQTESEQPAGYHLGRSVEASLDRARVQLTPSGVVSGKPLEGRLILFTVNFRMRP
jgi:hypothetical protein